VLRPCREIRYESASDPVITRICWCRVCQYLGAGSGTVNVCFPTASFTVHGVTGDYRSIADSGNVMHRRFCAACGTQLFSEAEARPHLIFVRAGTLDDPEIAKPAVTIWPRERGLEGKTRLEHDNGAPTPRALSHLSRFAGFSTPARRCAPATQGAIKADRSGKAPITPTRSSPAASPKCRTPRAKSPAPH
jgi:hypothetical protein